MMTPTQQFIVAMTKIIAPFLFGGLLGWHAPAPRYMKRMMDRRKSAKEQMAEAVTKPRGPLP